ncbi:MAG: FliI/YscN family ATPase [bacterium]|nr:FliI/YscN family ATPase [bacterium]
MGEASPVVHSGRVVQVVGLVIESQGPHATVGEACRIRTKLGWIPAEVVGFRSGRVLLMPLGEAAGIAPGAEVIALKHQWTVPVGEELLGRVLDGLGKPMDGKGALRCTKTQSLQASAPNPLTRTRISQPFITQVRAIDSLMTIGKGQRMGIFAGSGVGKSVLLGQIAKFAKSDVAVIGLVGERGREVREFIERDLGEEGLKRSVVVVATSDQPALVRLKASLVATAIAEYFRNQGKDVVLMMDSATRLAMAQREVGLTIGEPPTTKGYTPSVFAMLPKLFERAGNNDVGSITGLYTILVDGDDLTEPIADAARSILDGHLWLSRKFASLNRYPAIDPLQSISRVMPDVVSKEHYAAAKKVVSHLATHSEAEDLINIGAYTSGSNPAIDRAITKFPAIVEFLRQGMTEITPYEETVQRLQQLAA